MRDYINLLNNFINDNQYFENYKQDNILELNISRYLNEVKEDSSISLSTHINSLEQLSELYIVHNTQPELLLDYIKDNKIRVNMPCENEKITEFNANNYLNCFLGKDFWMMGLCEIRFKKEITLDKHYFITKNHSLFENNQLLIEDIMKLSDLERFLKDYLINTHKGIHLISNSNKVLERPNIYLASDIPFEQVKSIKCASKTIYDYLITEIKKLDDYINKEMIMNLLWYEKNTKKFNKKYLPLIAVQLSDKDYICDKYFSYKDIIYLYSDKFNEFIKIGPFSKNKKLINYLLNMNKITLANIKMKTKQTITYILKTESFEINGTPKELFKDVNEHDIKKYEISDISLELFNNFLIESNKHNINMAHSLRISYANGLFRNDVNSIIEDDDLDSLTDYEKEIIIGIQIEREKYISSLVKEKLNSDNIEKYLDLNFFFRRLFLLEGYGLISLDKRRKRL